MLSGEVTLKCRETPLKQGPGSLALPDLCAVACRALTPAQASLLMSLSPAQARSHPRSTGAASLLRPFCTPRPRDRRGLLPAESVTAAGGSRRHWGVAVSPSARARGAPRQPAPVPADVSEPEGRQNLAEQAANYLKSSSATHFLYVIFPGTTPWKHFQAVTAERCPTRLSLCLLERASRRWLHGSRDSRQHRGQRSRLPVRNACSSNAIGRQGPWACH